MLRELLTINPRGGRPAHNPRKKRAKHRAKSHRRNPRLLGKVGGLVKPVLPALAGGAGALGVDILLAQLPKFLPLPDAIKAQLAGGPLRTLARVGIAFALGYGARFVVSKDTADQFAAGAFTVIAYDELKSLLNRQMPQLLSAYSYDGDLSAYREAVDYNALPAVAQLSAYRAARPAGSYERDVMNGLQPVVR